MNGFKKVILLIGLLLCTGIIFAQKSKYQGIFIYNFTRYIKWPDDMQSGDFVIGVLGDSDVLGALNEMAKTKKQTQGMNLVIKNFKSVNEISKCHILFVSDNKTGNISEIVANPLLDSTLIITDSPGLANKGATINFVEQDGRIKFELNRANAEQRNLKVSGSLLNLAILV